MIMSTEMNEDGTMAVTATYTVSATVNVRNSASEKEINEAFEMASKMAGAGGISELTGTDMPAMIVSVTDVTPVGAATNEEKKPAGASKSRKAEDKAAVVNSVSNLAHLPRNLLG